jgi:signal transduction histidine kinase
VAVVAVTLLLFAVPLVLLARSQAYDAALDTLAARLEQAATLVDERSRTCAEVQVNVAGLASDAVDVAVFDRTGALRFAASTDGPTTGVLPAGAEVATAADGATGRATVGDRIVAAVPLSTAVCRERLVLRGVASAGPARAAATRATTLLGLAAAGALALGAAVAAVVGRRLVRPLEALAASAERLGEGDFSERAPRSGLPEADAIGLALDRTADRLGRAVGRGTAFAADASHQLRTPLTALRLHLETLPTDDPAVREAVGSALAEADRLEATVAELVGLTSLDEADAAVDLAALVRDRAETWRRRAEMGGRDVQVTTAPVPPRRVRPAAVAQALEVLVDNALVHGRGTVRVVVQPSTPDSDVELVRIAVGDDGRGPGADDLEVLRQRDRGAPVPVHGGRGLPLARALVEGEQGQLVAEQREGHTWLVLLLPRGAQGAVSADDVPTAGGNGPGAAP